MSDDSDFFQKTKQTLRVIRGTEKVLEIDRLVLSYRSVNRCHSGEGES